MNEEGYFTDLTDRKPVGKRQEEITRIMANDKESNTLDAVAALIRWRNAAFLWRAAY